ncbi:WYL domain-containing protein [Georgenia sp. 311]|uniref:WYL domain-containing protein n=1 Tax=Georgenia wutianyii TaxID=2585135 RepID=A0ABX5VRI4_9MICO|nr:MULTISPECIES: WYL domain-containing protein [Georgenia]QDB79195.1 WYL domain-containing protein [Georgenia wutianyii]TNC19137.1 WYL domain-containing protein [Georgenia sp. 311]
MAETTGERLTRLLALIAYLGDNPGVPVADVAAHFRVSPQQIVADVNLLWVTGTPGYLPDDLIDFAADEYDRQVLTLTNPRGMDRPLRLAAHEALALLVALKPLEALSAEGGIDDEVLRSTTAKLTAAAGEAARAAEAVDVHVSDATAALAPARRAMAEGRRLHLRYVSAADVVTERDVDPLELVWDGSQWYLRAWCHRVDGLRHFRLDRVLAAEVLDTPAAHQPESTGRTTEPELDEDDLLAELELAPRARWLAERVPVVDQEDLPDGGLRVRLRVADPAWLTNVVLGLGPEVRAVAPPELAAAVAARAADALAAYDALSSAS